jgi:hypothetical protein
LQVCLVRIAVVPALPESSRQTGAAAHAIVGIPSYYGLAKILFGVDNLTIPEDQMASGFARIILEGLHAVMGSSGKNRKSGAVTGRRCK